MCIRDRCRPRQAAATAKTTILHPEALTSPRASSSRCCAWTRNLAMSATRGDEVTSEFVRGPSRKRARSRHSDPQP
eukprot:13336381-Alexandrium_andersonii.AAC.1